MDNIFEGAKFGDKFLTRDGEIAVYISIRIEPLRDAAFLIIEGEKTVDEFYLNGKIKIGYSGNDIISKYQEQIDESWMEEKALYSMPNDVIESNDYIQGWIDGAKYIMNC